MNVSAMFLSTFIKTIQMFHQIVFRPSSNTFAYWKWVCGLAWSALNLGSARAATLPRPLLAAAVPGPPLRGDCTPVDPMGRMVGCPQHPNALAPVEGPEQVTRKWGWHYGGISLLPCHLREVRARR